MTKRSLAIALTVLALLVGRTGLAKDKDFQLRLEVDRTAVNLDDVLDCKLILEGPGLTGLPQGRPSQFWYSFQYTPTTVGSATIGPYSIPWGDQKLLSNAVPIQVVPAPSNPRNLRLFVSDTSVARGQSFVLTIVQIHGEKVERPRLVPRGASAHSFGRTIAIRPSKSWSTVDRYRITPAEAGALTIDASWFTDLPEGVSVEAVTVQVK